MGRISNYQEDSVVGPKDKVVGSELIGYNSGGAPYYKTRNFTMFDIQTFVMGGNFTFSEPINIVIGDDGIRNWSHNNITVSTPSAATSTLTHSGQFTVVTGITTDNYTEDSLIVTKGHVKQINTATYTLPDYKFNIAADSNPGSDDAIIDINSSSFDTLNVLGGAVLTSKITAGDTITIDHNEYTARSIDTSAVDVLDTFTSDVYGHVTAATKRTLPTMGSGNNYAVGLVLAGSATHGNNFLRKDGTWDKISFDIAADSPDASGSPNKEITNSETLTITGGTYLTSQVSADNTITIKHNDASDLNVTNIPSITNTSFGGTFTVMGESGVGRDDQGHLTSARPVTVTIPNTLFTGPSGSPLVNGTIGLVPAPGAADGSKFLRGDAQWATVVQTDISSTNGTFVSLSSLSGATGSVTIAPDLSAGGTPNSLTFLRGDNQWATPPGTYVLPIATSSIRGGIELRYDTNLNNAANAATAVAGRTYGLQLNSNNQAVINVPWTDSQLSTEAVQDIVGAMFSSNTETRISATYQDGDGTIDLAVDDMTANDNTQNTTTLSFVDSTNDIILRNTTGGAGSGSDDIKFVAGSNITLTHTNADNITIASTDTNTTYSANSGVDLAGTVFSLDVTSTTANSFFQVPFFNSAGQALSRDASTSSSIFFNPNSNTLSVKQISIGTTSVINTRSIFSQSGNTSGNYFEIRSTMTNGTGGSVVMGVAGAANRIYSYNQTGSNTSTRKFEIVTSGGDVGDFVFNTNGDMTVSSGDVNADNFCVSSDRRLKSEIEPIKEGLEVIKKFSSYNYIKSGKKESGFIAQEVKEVLPHTVYENEEGMLSMSDRGVLAHMHKAILELEERLISIEEKLN